MRERKMRHQNAGVTVGCLGWLSRHAWSCIFQSLDPPAHNAQHCQVDLASGRSLVLVVLARAGQTNSATTLDLFLPTCGDRPSFGRYGAMVERRDGLSWLRHDDDDGLHFGAAFSGTSFSPFYSVFSRIVCFVYFTNLKLWRRRGVPVRRVNCNITWRNSLTD